jgi:hypothetical protein
VILFDGHELRDGPSGSRVVRQSGGHTFGASGAHPSRKTPKVAITAIVRKLVLLANAFVRDGRSWIQNARLVIPDTPDAELWHLVKAAGFRGALRVVSECATRRAPLGFKPG